MNEITAPLTPPDCDLRDFAFMPLDVVRLRDSELSIQATGEEFRCAVLLWCAAWHQVPAASLPDDPRTLASLAGFGRVVAEWEKHKAGALRGWVKCSDGRLYHPVVAEKANEAWRAKHEHAHRKLLERLRKKDHPKDAMPTFDAWISAGKPSDWPTPSGGNNDSSGGNCEFSGGKGAHSGGRGDVSSGNAPEFQRNGAGIPAENPLKGQGQGQGQGKEKVFQAAVKAQPSSRARGSPAAAEKPPPSDPIHARAVELSVLLRQRGAALQASDPKVRAWAESGVTDAQALAALETAQSRRHEQASAQPINAGYLDTLIRAPAPVARRANGATPKSFAQRDREDGWRRWEQQTGEVHPDRVRCGDAAAVIDVEAAPVQQLEAAP